MASEHLNMVATPKDMTSEKLFSLQKMKLPTTKDRYEWNNFKIDFLGLMREMKYDSVIMKVRPTLYITDNLPTAGIKNLKTIQFYVGLNENNISRCAGALKSLMKIAEGTGFIPMIQSHHGSGTDPCGRPDLAWKEINDYYEDSVEDEITRLRFLLSNFNEDIQKQVKSMEGPIQHLTYIIAQLKTLRSRSIAASSPTSDRELIQMLRKAMTTNGKSTFDAQQLLPEAGQTFDHYATLMQRRVEDNLTIFSRSSITAHQLNEVDAVNTVTNGKPDNNAKTNALRHQKGKPGPYKHQRRHNRRHEPYGGKRQDKDNHVGSDGDSTRPTCTTCNKRGHTADVCRSHIECHICHKMGHYASDCFSNPKNKDSRRRPQHRTNTAQASSETTTWSPEQMREINTLRETLNLMKKSVYHTFSTTQQTANTQTFIIDPGANTSTCKSKELLDTCTPYTSQVRSANGAISIAAGIGSKGNINNILFIPEFGENLISLGQMLRAGYNFVFTSENCYAIADQNVTLVGRRKQDGLYRATEQLFSLPMAPHSVNNIRTRLQTNHDLWHHRLNHAHRQRLYLMKRRNLATNFAYKMKPEPQPVCATCATMKATRKGPGHMPMSTHDIPSISKPQDSHTSESKYTDLDEPSDTETARAALQARRLATEKLSKFCMDIKGPMDHPGRRRQQYVLTITCYRTRYRWSYSIKHKDDTLTSLKHFHKTILMLRQQLSIPLDTPLTYRSDNGGEFVNAESNEWLYTNLIQQKLTAPHTPHQNGIAERSNRTLAEASNCIMHATNCPPHLWSEAWDCAVYIENRLTSQALEYRSTPFEELFGTKPDFKHIRTFGSKAYALIPETLRTSNARTKEGIFVGYDTDSPSYLFYNPQTQQITKTAQLIFDEDARYQQLTDPTVEELQPELVEIVPPPTAETNPTISGTSIPRTIQHMNQQPQTTAVTPQNLRTNPPRRAQRNQTRRENRRTRSGRTYHCGTQITTSNVTHALISEQFFMNVPSVNAILQDIDYNTALTSSDGVEWKQTLRDEIEYLHYKLNTWTFLPELPPGTKALGHRWRLSVKDTGKKARLTIKGCGQKEGIDFNDTFSPVARLSHARLLIALAAATDAHLFTIDIKAAFPNATLEEDIYMKIPPDVTEVLRLDPSLKYAKLNKALYGLKQASREWFKLLSKYLNDLGYKQSPRESCMHFKDNPSKQHQPSHIKFTNCINGTWILVYVDDMLILTHDLQSITNLKEQLEQKFQLKMSECKQFLGIDIKRNKSAGTIDLDLSRYIEQTISELEEEMKITMTSQQNPMASDPKQLSTADTTNMTTCNISLYRKLIGILNYITCATRLDIAYAVNQCAKFLTAPFQIHLDAVLHIFGYLKANSKLVIRYYRRGKLDYHGFSDSSHHDCPITLRSTCGWVTKLAGGPVNWKSTRLATPSIGGTNESEFRALTKAAQELISVRRMLQELHFIIDLPTTLWGDNSGSVLNANDVKSSRKLNHLLAHEFAIQQWVHDKELIVKGIRTEDQQADIFTKRMETRQFITIRNKLIIQQDQVPEGDHVLQHRGGDQTLKKRRTDLSQVSSN